MKDEGPAWLAAHVSLVAVAVAACSFVIMTDINELVSAVEQRDRSSFSTNVLTRLHLRPWDVAELADAFSLWRGVERSSGVPVSSWIAWHNFVDFFFMAAYGVLLWRGLLKVRYSSDQRSAERKRRAVVLVGIPVVADVLETALTLVVTKAELSGHGWLIAIQALSTIKWATLACVVVTLAALFANPRVEGDVGLRTAQRAMARNEPAASLPALVVLVGLFAALVALPAGGPLEQLPDVIRSQLVHPQFLGASIALVLLVGAVTIAGWRATGAVETRRPPPTSRALIGSALVVAGIGCGLASAVNQALTVSPAAPLIVIVGLSLVAALHRWFTRPPRRRSDKSSPGASPNNTDPEDDTGGAVASPTNTVDADTHGAVASPITVDDADTTGAIASPINTADDYETTGAVAPKESSGGPTASDPSAAAVAALAGFVVLVGALGLVRATVRPTLLEQRYFLAFGLGITGAVLGPLLAVAFASRRRRVPRVVQKIVVALCLAAYALLAVVPHAGRYVGTNGVVALSFSVFALVLGELIFKSRSRHPWWASRQLGLGQRTPWIALLIASWLLAGVIDTAGGYHDVRDVAALADANTLPGASDSEHTDLRSAVTKWQQHVASADCDGRDGRTPLLMVAAPGGGIRAAYWTASVLDKLAAESPCGRGNVFMISGVSGGSVGTAVWLSSPDGVSAAQQVKQLGQDRALAGTVASLLTRDLFQPLAGLRRAWPDRAAVQASLWVESTKFSGLLEPAPFSPKSESVAEADRAQLDSRWPHFADHAWDPVVVFNAASVTDGCRVLVANVGTLPAAGGECPNAGATTSGAPLGGPITASTAAFAPHPSVECSDRTPKPTMALAALTSARFPVVSPSGAIRHCDAAGNGGTHVTYAVDGGYFENTGLLTLLQLWAEVEPLVDPATVDPWIVLADNGYRSAAARSTPSRPRELLIPLRTKGANQALSTAALEQMARLAMRDCNAQMASYVRLGPRREPSVTAPLGWVLSDDSVGSLDEQLRMAFVGDSSADGSAWVRLSKRLRPPAGDRTPSCE